MKSFEKEGLKWFEFPSLQKYKNLKHGILTRQGGFSKDPYDSLDLSLSPAGNTRDVKKNLTKVENIIGLKNVIFSKQVHGSKVIPLTRSNIDQPLECDGFVTNEKEITLLIKHADCQAALFWDPKKQVIGNVHCGWRGNVLNIYQSMVETMQKYYGCEVKDIHVCISPSLGPFSSEFKNYQDEFPKNFWNFQVRRNYFDLWAIAEKQLLDLKISKENIEIAKVDTYQSKESFFSYRRDKKTGRNATFITLR